jgi:GntR family transcriptional regulator
MTIQAGFIFSVAADSACPIYKQLADQTRRHVQAKVLVAGDQMPSVRSVAKALEVNVMTVSKAYSLLESQGILERQVGRGMLVADNAAIECASMLGPMLAKAAEEARLLGLSSAAAIVQFRKYLRAA